MVIATILQSY